MKYVYIITFPNGFVHDAFKCVGAAFDEVQYINDYRPLTHQFYNYELALYDSRELTKYEFMRQFNDQNCFVMTIYGTIQDVIITKVEII